MKKTTCLLAALLSLGSPAMAGAPQGLIFSEDYVVCKQTPTELKYIYFYQEFRQESETIPPDLTDAYNTHFACNSLRIRARLFFNNLEWRLRNLLRAWPSRVEKPEKAS